MRRLAAALLTTLLIPRLALAAEPLEYNRDIRPILADKCFACHGPDSAARKADLRLDRREAAIESGAITEGQPGKSELIARILSDDPELVMPPLETKKSLKPAEKEKLKQWVTDGATYQPQWSFIVPVRPDQPTVQRSEWVKTPIDRFLLARLEAAGLAPASEADPRTLFRRLSLDITGLPPAPDDVAKFLDEYQSRGEAALSEWIDRLMESSAWGEHRARYWLDAARYADTHGLHFDNYREMWPYRDWVIRAFNSNQRFNEFIVEQIAGDLLPDPSDDQLIATGFQRCNITTNEGGTIDEENLANYAADRVQTFGWVFLGLTTNCGQCHDHKFDAFTMRDYYSLAAFFRNTTQGPKDGNVKDGRGPSLAVPTPDDLPRWKSLPNEISAATAHREDRKKNARPGFNRWLETASVEALAQSLPSDGLVLAVPLNEGPGKEVKSSTEPVRTFSTSGDVQWVEGGNLGSAPVIKPGATFDLGEVGDFERNQSFSFGVWVKTPNAGIQAGILARMDEKADYRGWDLWQNGAAFATHIIDKWPDNALKVATRNNTVKPGIWQHVFVTYDGSGSPGGVKIYVDGREEPLRVENQSLKADATIRTTTSLRIGQRSHTQVFDGGSVQDVRIYSRRLGETEVKAISEQAALRTLLATAADQRTPQQNVTLYNHYLNSVDTEYPALAKAVADLEAERDTIRGRSPVTHIQQEKMDTKPVAFILTRGEYDRPTDQVEAATPAALHPLPEGSPANRLGLAQWLIDPANPLTARVTVNRFWQEIFGQGLVTTPEDFGVMGAAPSHRELLDWLAVEFRESNWDVKKFYKLLLTSAAYRQSATVTPEKLEHDRHNTLLSRGPRFRMDAEMVRDYALATSGLLSRKLYGPGVRPYQPIGIWDLVGLPGGDTRNYVQDGGENLYRRTLYDFWKRMAPPPNLEAFNAPSREVCAVRRERTNTPLQALVTLNDPQFVEAARYLAEAALKAGAGDDAVILAEIARRVLCRPMSDQEAALVQASRVALQDYYQQNPEDAKQLVAVGDSAAPVEADLSQLAAWTMVCNQLLNLDETLNK